MDEDDIIKVAILKKHAKHFAQFARNNRLPIYRVAEENDMMELAKEALKSPVLTEVVKGAVRIYTDEKEGPGEDFTIDAEFDIPKKKGDKNAEEEEE
jgi:hypothetical protein